MRLLVALTLACVTIAHVGAEEPPIEIIHVGHNECQLSSGPGGVLVLKQDSGNPLVLSNDTVCTVFHGSIQIVDNNSTEQITYLNHIDGDLSIIDEGFGGIKSVDLPHLLSVAGLFWVLGVNGTHIDASELLAVDDNVVLERVTLNGCVNMPLLSSVGGSLKIIHSEIDECLSFSSLYQVIGTIVMVNNRRLPTLSLPSWNEASKPLVEPTTSYLIKISPNAEEVNILTNEAHFYSEYLMPVFEATDSIPTTAIGVTSNNTFVLTATVTNRNEIDGALMVLSPAAVVEVTPLTEWYERIEWQAHELEMHMYENGGEGEGGEGGGGEGEEGEGEGEGGSRRSVEEKTTKKTMTEYERLRKRAMREIKTRAATRRSERYTSNQTHATVTSQNARLAALFKKQLRKESPNKTPKRLFDAQTQPSLATRDATLSQ
jgi:hypothetical protein